MFLPKLVIIPILIYICTLPISSHKIYLSNFVIILILLYLCASRSPSFFQNSLIMSAGALLCSLLINACEEQLAYSKPLILLQLVLKVLLTLQLLIITHFCKEPDTVLILNSVVWRLSGHCVLNLQTVAQMFPLH